MSKNILHGATRIYSAWALCQFAQGSGQDGASRAKADLPWPRLGPKSPIPARLGLELVTWGRVWVSGCRVSAKCGGPATQGLDPRLFVTWASEYRNIELIVTEVWK